MDPSSSLERGDLGSSAKTIRHHNQVPSKIAKLLLSIGLGRSGSHSAWGTSGNLANFCRTNTVRSSATLAHTRYASSANEAWTVTAHKTRMQIYKPKRGVIVFQPVLDTFLIYFQCYRVFVFGAWQTYHRDCLWKLLKPSTCATCLLLNFEFSYCAVFSATRSKVESLIVQTIAQSGEHGSYRHSHSNGWVFVSRPAR